MMLRRAAATVVLALLTSACSFAPPDLDEAERRRDQSSRVLAADGTVLTTVEAVERREDVRLAELPDHLPDAVVAIEDARFWSHRGVDLRALGRAAVRNADEGRVVEGGSTITQQYVKNALLDPERTLGRKVEEAVLALRLERTYSKERILELYLNTIYFGNGAYGIEAAATEYFGVRARDLTLEQSATLAGLIRAPDGADPVDEPELARRRRNRVLARMVDLGRLPRAESRRARATPLSLAVRPAEERYPAAHLVEQAKRFVLRDERFGATPEERRDLLLTGGLRITTTLDPVLQQQAEAAATSVRPEAPGPEVALVAVEPSTGYVKALVGGRDFFGPGTSAEL
ncbi:MAG: transglycosylase domain-containing protein, partial [Acidimicrobiia bacterium]|nr:transglycosylase domain-containing protein [Acidimicrobiia bacterium]